MLGFGFGKNIFLGVDIGSSSIKLVELTISSGKPVLSNYAWMIVPDIAGKDDLDSQYYSETLPKFLKSMVKEAGINGKKAYASLPSFGGLITLINFPAMNKDDVEQAMHYEAHKYIPASLEDVVLSWDIIGGDDVLEGKDPGKAEATVSQEGEKKAPAYSEKKMQVLLVAASKNKVAKYEKVIKDVGFELKLMELESFSLVTSLIGNDPGNFVIVDIGSRFCNILLVEKGIIKANRNIDAGGLDLTRTISRSLGVDNDRAEKMKISGKNFFTNESGISFPSLETISGEAVRMINNYYKNKPHNIDSVILSGGTSGLAGITEYFYKTIGIKTIIGNPFSRVEYDKKSESAVRKVGNQFAVSLGVALKGVDAALNKKS